MWEVTQDPKFVTARHSLRSIWRVDLAGDEQQKLIINNFTDHSINCPDEKNYTLIRYAFCDVYNFTSASKNSKIKELTSYVIKIS